MLEIDKDPVAISMGAYPVERRTDYAIVYQGQSFTLAAKSVEEVRAGRPPRKVDGPTYSFRYRRAGETMTVTGTSLEGPLECTRRCFDLAFLHNIDARYSTTTDPAILCTGQREE